MPDGVSVWRMTLADGDKKMYAEVPFSADGTFAGYRMADEAPRIIPANFDVKRGASAGLPFRVLWRILALAVSQCRRWNKPLRWSTRLNVTS